MDDKDYHAWLLECFRDAEEATEDAREDARLNLDYYDGRQWTDAEARALRRRGQPALVFNVIRPKIDYLQGGERNQRTKPRALPRTQGDEDQAHAATDVLRYVCDKNDYDDKRSRVWGDMLKVGWGGHEITVEEKPGPVVPRYPVGASVAPMGGGGAGDNPASELMGSTALTPPPPPAGPQYDVRIRRCQWDRMLWDPFSREDDFSDASYLGLVVWMDRDEAVRKYGEGAGQVFDETCTAESTTTFADKPEYETWVHHGHRKRVRIVQLYHLSPEDGEWDFCEFTRGGILQSGSSPWIDEEGSRQHPYAWRSAYVDGDNDRYGPIRDMRPVQDEINKRRSKALHHYTVRQTYGRQGSLGEKSVKDLRNELARPDGHVELASGVEWGKDFGIIQTNDQSAGHMRLLEEAQAFFQTIGPNASQMGVQGSAPSGRAILANQQGGQVQLGTLTDALRQIDLDCYRKVWLRVKQFWTGQMMLRVTDDPDNMRFVELNKPVAMGMDGQPVLDNDMQSLDIDIYIDEAPSNGSLPDETFAQIVQLKTMDQNNEIPFSYMLELAPNLPSDKKRELVKMTRERENQPPNPIQVAGAQADVAGKQADAQLKQAQAARTAAEIPGIQQGDAADAAHTAALTRKAVTETHGSATATVLDALQAAAALQAPLTATPPGYTVPAG